MEKKNSRIMVAVSSIALAAVAFAGCDNGVDGSALAGSPVSLSGRAGILTRTSLAGEVSSGMTVSWASGDEVYVSCAEAASGNAEGTDGTIIATGVKQYAKYVVGADGTFSVPENESAESYGIRWKYDLTYHTFYSIYPYSCISDIDNWTVAAAPETVTVRIDDTQNTTAYTISSKTHYADMTHDLMWGLSDPVQPSSSPVTLTYGFVSAALRIGVKNSSSFTINDISGITVTSTDSNTKLSGDFTLTMADGFLAQPASGDAGTSAVISPVIDLEPNEEADWYVYVFLPVTSETGIDASTLTITLNYADGTKTAALYGTAGSKYIKPSKIVSVTFTCYDSGIASIISVDDWGESDLDITVS